MKKVLVVKREAELIAPLLRGIPVEFHFASNPREAIDVMKTLGGPFDLILMGAIFEDTHRREAAVQGPGFVRKRGNEAKTSRHSHLGYVRVHRKSH